MDIISLIKSEVIKDLVSRTTYDGDCWVHQGSNRNGYANVMIYGRVIDVHRLSASLYHGLDLDDTNSQANHKSICRFRACWNPEHLYVGTHSDNMKDKSEKPCNKCGKPRTGRQWDARYHKWFNICKHCANKRNKALRDKRKDAKAGRI